MRLTLPVLVFVGLAACDSGTEDRSDISSTRVVHRPYVAVPPGSLPRGAGAQAAALAAPGPPVTPDLVARGRERFVAFCSPCHGAAGRGDGVVVSRGFPAPPSYHQDRLRRAPPEHVVDVITNGRGLMYSYAERVTPEERWAIAHYVKALQAAEPGPGGGTSQ